MKAYTNIEQSKKLAEILPTESADHHYVRKVTDFRGNPVDGEWSHPKYGNPNSKYAKYVVQNFSSYEKLPCLSLAALLGVLPCPSLDNTFGEWRCQCYKEDHHVATAYADDPVDACYKMILKLHKEKML